MPHRNGGFGVRRSPIRCHAACATLLASNASALAQCLPDSGFLGIPEGGLFTPAPEFATGPRAFSFVDMDADADPDLLGAALHDSTSPGIHWYENLGTNSLTFGTTPAAVFGREGTRCVAGADLDLDGDTDVIALAPFTGAPAEWSVTWYDNQGDNQTFIARQVSNPSTIEFDELLIADVNADGRPDILFIQDAGLSARMAINRPDGPSAQFQMQIVSPSGNDRAIGAIAVADVNDDALLDIVLGREDETIWRRNQGDPDMDGLQNFATETISTSPLAAPQGIGAADMNADGLIDIVQVWDDGRSVRMMLQDPGSNPPTFTNKPRLTAIESYDVARFEIGDVDADGVPDVVVAWDQPDEDAPLVTWSQNLGANTPDFGWFRSFTLAERAPSESTGAVGVPSLDDDPRSEIVVASRRSGRTYLRSYSGANLCPVRIDGIDACFATIEEASFFAEMLFPAPDIHVDGVTTPCAFEGFITVTEDASILLTGNAEFPPTAVIFAREGSRIETTDGTPLIIEAAFVGQSSFTLASAGGVTFGGEGFYERDGSTLSVEGDANLRGVVRTGYGLNSNIETLSGGAHARHIVRGDFDADGQLDIAISGVEDINASTCVSRLRWARRLGNSFQSPQTIAVVADAFSVDGFNALAAADLNADGADDILVASGSFGLVAMISSGGPSVSFQDVPIGAFIFPDWIRAADLDADDDLDVVVFDPSSRRVALFLNDGADPPAFVAAPDITASADAAVLGDLNRDGRPDVVSFDDQSGMLTWHRNLGAAPPGFGAVAMGSLAVAGDGIPQLLEIVDMNGDAIPDVVGAEFDRAFIMLNASLTAPSLTRREAFVFPEGVLRTRVADIDGDGSRDLVAARVTDVLFGSSPCTPDRTADVLWLANDGRAQPTFTVRPLGPPFLSLLGPLAFGPDAVLSVVGQPGEHEIAWYEPGAEAIRAIDVVVRKEFLFGDGQPDPTNLSVTGSTTFELATVRVIEDSTIASVGPIRILPANSVFGDGVLQAPVLENAGEIVLSLAPFLEGPLRLVGDFTPRAPTPQGPTRAGRLVVEIDADGATGAMSITGSAELAGTLEVRPVGALTPLALGAPFLTADAFAPGSRFDVALLPNIGASEFLSLVYDEGGARADGTRTIAGVSLQSNPLGADVALDPQPAQDSGSPGVPQGATLADIDQDDDLDLLIALPDATNPTTAPGSVVVLLNDDDGVVNNGWEGFGGVVVFPAGVNPSGVGVGLLDGDAQPDIVVSNRGAPGNPAPDSVSVLLLQAGGLATSAVHVINVGDEPADVLVLDLDADGAADIATPNAAGHSISVAWNSGSGLGPAWLGSDEIQELDLPDDAECPLSIRPGDFDAGIFFAVSNAGNDTVGLVAVGALRELTVLASIPVGAEPIDLIVADLDLDGQDDVATVNRAGSSVSILLNESVPASGVLTMGEASSISIDTQTSLPRAIAAGDFDADPTGDIDLAVLADGVIKLRRNDLTAGQLAFTALPDEPADANPPLVLAGDINADGKDDVVTIAESTGAKSGARGAPAFAPIQTLLACPCAADTDADCDTDVLDFGVFLAAFGDTGMPPGAPGDFDRDGDVDVLDFSVFLMSFGCDG